ncbi:MAG: STAS domain-containing protein [Candidatus Sumerlaeia bacterium]
MDINHSENDWGILVQPRGDLDIASRQELSELPCLSNCRNNVIIDLAEVDYMDSSGLGALVQVIRLFRKENYDLILCSPTKSIEQLLQFTSVDKIVRIFENREQAIEALLESKNI